MANKIIGVNFNAQQEDLKTNGFMAGIGTDATGTAIVETDVDRVSDAINATGELTVTGSSIVFREEGIDPATIKDGSVGIDLKYQKITLGLENGKNIFVSGKLPDDAASMTGMATAIKTKSIAGSVVAIFGVKEGVTQY